MTEILEIIVIFKRNEVIRQSFALNSNQMNSNEFKKNDCNQIESIKSDQIIVFSDYCQTIRFLKELNSCLNYRLKVFDRLKLKVFKKNRFNSCGQTLSFDNHSINTIDPNIDKIRVVVELQSMDHRLAIDKNWFVFTFGTIH